MRVYSPLGDGSTDVSTTEQECVGLRISWGGLPRNEFIGLEALDLKDGRDGKSPDAQCLSKCYDRQMIRIYNYMYVGIIILILNYTCSHNYR